MRVGVIGVGHVGLVTAACFAHIGHEVVGVDSDQEKIERLRRGTMPFFEPGLAELVEEGVASGRLRFDGDLADAVGWSEVIFICVGTPATASGAPDLLELERLACDIALHLEGYRVVVEKSTVPVTTGDRVTRTLTRGLGRADFDVVSNPEFLREGTAIEDTLRPTRVVIGSSSERATRCLLDVYGPILDATGCPVITTDVRTAELIKHASNAFLATKISFINAVGEICERVGADVEVVAEGMGSDPRIGAAFLRAGAGYGGSCLPKDVSGFLALARELGCDLSMLEEVRRINERASARIAEKLRRELWHLAGKSVAVLGLAFKPGTDDLREAPALRVIEAIQAEGASVVVYDPFAMGSAKELLTDVRFAAGALDALSGAHAAVLMTDWDEFRELDLDAVREVMRFPIIVDGRNLFALADMKRAGFSYQSVGRPAVFP